MKGDSIHFLAANSLSFAQWEGEESGVVYDRRSGDTHLVSTLGIRVLHRLMREPVSLSGLCAFLGRELEVDRNEQLESQARLMVRQLAQKGLVYRFLK